jgi:hypothetical protein
MPKKKKFGCNSWENDRRSKIKIQNADGKYEDTEAAYD